MSTGTVALAELLAHWLPAQRWFAGKGRPIAVVDLVHCHELAGGGEGPQVWHVLALARFADGGEQLYQVPLSVRGDQRAELDSALVGTAQGTIAGYVYDALRDQAASGVLLHTLLNGGDAELVASVTRPDLHGGPGLVIGAEQSNTSVVFGGSLILKVFRRLSPGINPDLEVTRALDDAGSDAIIPPYGWLSGTVDGEETTLALLQPFLSSALEGWKLAQASVRDLYAEEDLHADEVGGDFAGESDRLGRATGEVHRTLAEVLPTRTAGPAEVAEMIAGMHARLDAAAAEVPALARHATALHRIYDRAADRREVELQRIHGDFHLGQVLRVERRWVLVDFEGEPARPLAERRALASPIRDVAGMLRSFEYAARTLLADHVGQPGLVYRAGEWAERNRAAFCDGYAAATGVDPRADPDWLRALESDKAVYEVVYEARHRPTWVQIPLGAIERLAG